jgi:hypothetical protein
MPIIPAVKVEIEVDPSSALQPFFTLDDSLTGVLDGAFGLGGLSFVEISEFVQGVSISRGKSNQLEGFEAGNASVTLQNIDRTFDPEGTSPFKDQLLPRRGIKIYSGGTPIFFGIVEDWALDYDKSGDNTARAVATDKFLLLANQELEGYTNVLEQSGDRIVTVLDKPEVGWPIAERNIDTGQVQMQADVVDENTNVLNYLQTVANSESGSLFIAADGILTFQDKLTGPSSIDLLIFSDDGLETPFGEVSVIIGGEFLFNRVIVQADGGAAQLVEDLPSQGFFGVSTLSETELLMELDSEALSKATALLVKFRRPGYRFETVSTDLNQLNDAQRALVLSKDMTDVIEVKFTPNQIGSPIEKFGQIIGISHEISVSGSHRITFKLDTLEFAPFVLDDVVFGVLDGFGLG